MIGPDSSTSTDRVLRIENFGDLLAQDFIRKATDAVCKSANSKYCRIIPVLSN